MIGREADCPECGKPVRIQPAPPRERPATAARPTAVPPSSAVYDLSPPTTPAPAPPSDRYAQPSRLVPLVLDRDDEPTGPRIWASLFGVNVTPWRFLIAFLLLAGGIAAIVAWVATRPARATVPLVQPVATATIINSLTTITAANPGQTIHTVGGTDRLILTEPNGDGRYLLLQVDLPRDVLLRHAVLGREGTTIRADQFVLEGGHLPAKGWILADQFDGGMTINLADAPTRSGWLAIPPDIASASEEELGPESAAVTYDGRTGATGQLRFRPHHAATSAPGLHMTGELTVARLGPAANLVYHGDEVTIDWDDRADGWQAREEHTLDRPSRLPDRITITLLLPRPKRSTGPLTLTIGGETVATVDPAAALPQ